MKSAEEENDTAADRDCNADEKDIDVKILYNIVSAYPGGICIHELEQQYYAIKTSLNDNEMVQNIPSCLVDLKGRYVDYKTFDGIRVFSSLEKKVNPTLIHPFIKEVGDESPLIDAFVMSVIDCNSFVIRFKNEKQDSANFDKWLNNFCQQKECEMVQIKSWQVKLGDCFVVKCEDGWKRVKVVKIADDKNVLCFFVDHGDYCSFSMNDLRIFPDISTYPGKKILETVRSFKHHSYAIRCSLDLERKIDGFPMSCIGLRLALCGNEPMKTLLKVRFIRYCQEQDSFTVEVFTNDGQRNKLIEAVDVIPELLAKDKTFAMEWR